MSIADALVAELDQEMASTRKFLERVPEEKLEWKPHEKSMTMIGLVTHLANLPHWTVQTIDSDSFETEPKDGLPHLEPAPSLSAALSMFDESVATARSAIAAASDECLQAPWSLLAGGHPLFTLPRAAVLRTMILNHGVHHRAQLGVYLRLNDVPVPSVYGPTADGAE